MRPLKPAFRIFVLLMFLLVAAVTSQAQAVVYYEFDPPVIPANRSEPVLLRVKLNKNACPPLCGKKLPQVVLQTTPPIDMHDDGVEGDAKAGDGIYSARLPIATVTATLRPDDVYRTFVGYLDLLNEGTRLIRVNVFAPVVDGTVPTATATSIASDVQYTPNLVNIVDARFFEDQDRNRITRRFYKSFPDAYDFLNIVYVRSYIANRHHVGIRNSVRGIGQPIFDNGGTYGSASALLGVNVFPSAAYFDGASLGFAHETGHQWINHLKWAPLATDGAHWPPSTPAAGLMGMDLRTNGNEGGVFPCAIVQDGDTVRLMQRRTGGEFTDLDLYLMGLLAPEAVGENIVLTDAPSDIGMQCDGRVYKGKFRRVSISEVIAATGPRVPDYTKTPRKITMATIVVSPQPLDAIAMSFFSYFAQRAESTSPIAVHEGFAKGTAKPIAVTTRGLLSVDTTIRTKSEGKRAATP